MSHILGASQAIRTLITVRQQERHSVSGSCVEHRKNSNLSLIVSVIYKADTCSSVKGAGRMRGQIYHKYHADCGT